MRIHKKNQIKVLDCGCERCTACEGNGGQWEDVGGESRRFVDCTNCRGEIDMKLCRQHAVAMGWVEEKKK